MKALEEEWLAADDSWWTGRRPLHTRIVADVPRALYLNFLVEKAFAASLAPELFRPLELPGNPNVTLFTILLFSLERARPVWAPRALGALAPSVLQSNWRYYGRLLDSADGSRPGALFVRSVTPSLLLSFVGRRLARCFPLRRARRMMLDFETGRVSAAIESGGGSAPDLKFEGEASDAPRASNVFREQFPSYPDNARWIIDQHVSLAIWPRESVVQDMHLDFGRAKITPLQVRQCQITGLDDLAPGAKEPCDCFLVEGLKVFLDRIYSLKGGHR